MKLYTLDGQFIEETTIFPDNLTGIIEDFDGVKYWYLNNKLHRLDGPAIEHPDGTKWWYLNNKLHRLDGPAYEGSVGPKEWWVDNELVTEEQCKLLHDIMKLKGLL